ncbi:MAG: hypothetical protein J7J98_06250 [candidate division Zixibacteria bacterium]|nr:hypothetical protein [candidate division Zixibacteria bacterium]
MDIKQLSQIYRWSVIVTFLVLVVAAGSVRGQDVANGQATANVLAALSVTATQALQFGNVYQGVAKSQDETDDALSGIFDIVGAASAGISIYLTLPQYMALADGSDRMTIAFGTTDATVDTMNVTPSTVVATDGWVDTDPNNLPGVLVVGQAGQTNLYLGGKVIPAVDQAAGGYTGDIICNVAYNGT